MIIEKGGFTDWWFVHVSRIEDGEGYMFWTREQWDEFVSKCKELELPMGAANDE